VLAAQADLIPDQLVNVIAGRAREDLQDAHTGRIAETPFSGRPVLVAASEAAADVAGRLSGQIAPPRVSLPIPVWLTVPPVVTRPCAWVAASSCASVAPPPTRAVRASGPPRPG
jgi:hypothetical protein